jgi:hypothetical protein
VTEKAGWPRRLFHFFAYEKAPWLPNERIFVYQAMRWRNPQPSLLIGLVLLVVRRYALTALGHPVPALVAIGVATA